MKHGTLNGYTNYGCRCDRCCDAQQAYHRAYDAMHCAEHVDEYVERTMQSIAWFEERIELSEDLGWVP